ncbi:hypothetical protein [Microbulbifer sp. 2205BS26-8]|uniref:hypothetical protein n=1 Tax=Microbulbifer sp. 2205BS26-8 TaxID=3064386 RepID=UPI00273E1642|nr:hypothetical protein [Microbulbifer sp. 2205BS26-8]MDP5211237.1 hypothetical protein [Microbulbifer sp. 2205BS26-8]
MKVSIEKLIMKFRHFACIFFCNLLAQNVLAKPVDEYIVKAIDEIPGVLTSYKADILFEKSNTSVLIDLSLDHSGQTLVSFSITTKWGNISIPSNILGKLPLPQLNSIDVSYTPKKISDKDWSYSLRMHYGEYIPHKPEGDNYSLVEFGFDKNSLLDVTIFDAKENNSTLLYDKNP